MAVTSSELRAWVNAGAGSLDSELAACVAQAQALVDKYVDDYCSPSSPPEEVSDRAVMEVAADLWARRKAPNGILNQQFAAGDGDVGVTPIRISRDPLIPARPILAPWVTPLGFA